MAGLQPEGWLPFAALADEWAAKQAEKAANGGASEDPVTAGAAVAYAAAAAAGADAATAGATAADAAAAAGAAAGAAAADAAAAGAAAAAAAAALAGAGAAGADAAGAAAAGAAAAAEAAAAAGAAAAAAAAAAGASASAEPADTAAQAAPDAPHRYATTEAQHVLRRYAAMLRGDDEKVRGEAARAWSTWENSVYGLGGRLPAQLLPELPEAGVDRCVIAA